MFTASVVDQSVVIMYGTLVCQVDDSHSHVKKVFGDKPPVSHSVQNNFRNKTPDLAR